MVPNGAIYLSKEENEKREKVILATINLSLDFSTLLAQLNR